MLVKERDSWRDNFKAGGLPSSVVLKAYRESRNILDKKLPENIEEVCAYILYLENIKKGTNETLNKVMSNKRDYWNAIFSTGKLPDADILIEYRSFRYSELKRSTRLVEELCEYVLYLESLII